MRHDTDTDTEMENVSDRETDMYRGLDLGMYTDMAVDTDTGPGHRNEHDKKMR
jgi:hypothetical protein